MLFVLGLDEQVVGVTTNCNYPARAEEKEKIGGFFLNLEKIVSIKPDLVVMQEDAQVKDIKRFKEFGLPVCVLRLQSVEDVMAELVRLGQITSKATTAEAYVQTMRTRLASVEEKTREYRPRLFDVLKLWNPKSKQRKALVIVGLNPLIVAGEDTFINDVLKYAGVANVAAGASGQYLQYSFEKLVDDNPQYIIVPRGIIALRDLEQNKRWRSLEAVRKGRILFVDADILSRPGPRVVEAVEQIAEFIY